MKITKPNPNMRLEIKRNHLLLVPENEQDRAFIEDTLGLTKNGETIGIKRVNDVALGFQSDDKFVLKLEKMKE